MLQHLDNLIKNVDEVFHLYMSRSNLDAEMQANVITSVLVNFMAMHLVHVEETLLHEEQVHGEWRHKTVEQLAQQIFTLWEVNNKERKPYVSGRVLS